MGFRLVPLSMKLNNQMCDEMPNARSYALQIWQIGTVW